MNLNELFELPLYWEMQNAEKIALYMILEELQPKVSIEIGTKKGGSLQLIHHFSGKTYCLDIDTDVINLSSKFEKAEFIIGDSKTTLGKVLQNLKNKDITPEFILIDGDHTTVGIMEDIRNVLKIVPYKPLKIILHDSFNPDCRCGMLKIDYASNPHVHKVEIDFIVGVFSPNKFTNGQMWGGFAIIEMQPDKRQSELKIEESSKYVYDIACSISKHYIKEPQVHMNRIKKYIINHLY